MSFYWGTDIGDLIFKGATVNSVGGLICACFIFAFISFVYESLQFLVFESKLFREDSTEDRRASSDRSTLLSRNRCMMKIRRILLYTTNSTVNYFIMLAIMVYNSYLFISILIGTIAAYFLFGHRKFYRNIKIIDQRRKLILADSAEEENQELPTTDQEGDTPEECNYVCTVEINTTDRENILNQTQVVDETEQGPSSCCSPLENVDKNKQTI